MFLESLQWKLILDLTAPTDLLENEFRLGYLQNIIQVVDSRDFWRQSSLLATSCSYFYRWSLKRLRTSWLNLISAQSIKY